MTNNKVRFTNASILGNAARRAMGTKKDPSLPIRANSNIKDPKKTRAMSIQSPKMRPYFSFFSGVLKKDFTAYGTSFSKFWGIICYGKAIREFKFGLLGIHKVNSLLSVSEGSPLERSKE